MGNADSQFGEVDLLKYQLAGLERKLSSLEAAHQRYEIWPSAGRDAFICGAHLKCKRDVRVTLGPVIGKVTGDLASILLEVDRAAEVTCFICLSDEDCPQGRVVGQQVAFVLNRLCFIFVFVCS